MQIIAGLLAFAGLAAAQDFGTVHKPCSLRTPGKDYSHVTSPLPHEYLSLEDLPTTVDPRINASTTTIRNQHLPQVCDLLFHARTHALRLQLLTNVIHAPAHSTAARTFD